MRGHDVPEENLFLDAELREHAVHDRGAGLGRPGAGELALRRERDAADARAAIARRLADEDRRRMLALAEIRPQAPAPQRGARVLVVRRADSCVGQPRHEVHPGSLCVRDQLEQRPVRVAEVDARAGAAGAGPLTWPELGLDAARAEVRDRLVRRPGEVKAEVAVARPHGIGGARLGRRPRPVHVQLSPVGEPVRVAAAVELDDLGAEHVAVEGVRSFPVGDGDHDVIEAGYSHSIVAGGFDVTSRTTRFTPGISLTIRAETVSTSSYGSRAQSAVIAS